MSAPDNKNSDAIASPYAPLRERVGDTIYIHPLLGVLALAVLTWGVVSIVGEISDAVSAGLAAQEITLRHAMLQGNCAPRPMGDATKGYPLPDGCKIILTPS